MSKTIAELADEVAPDAYRITFHRDADGGPQHLLYLLRGYNVVLKKDGVALAEGMISDNDYTDEFVELHAYNEASGLNDGPVTRLAWDAFDEVMYL
jgi:hypothetical protein